MILLGMLVAATSNPLAAQDVVRTEADQVITLSLGSTAVISATDSITRVSVANPEIAEPVVIPPREVLINAKSVGATSLIVWRGFGEPRFYTVEVTADVASLQRQLAELYPEAGLGVTSTGSSIVLSGQVRDPAVVRKAIELANTQGIPVVDNVRSPPPEQILLSVEFAEVSKTSIKELGGDLVRIFNPQEFDEAVGDQSNLSIETLSEGFVTLLLQGNNSSLHTVIRALKGSGDFRSLAKPNLVTREGQEATFLAGGEFPFPTIQGGSNSSNAITITWKEFGIRLNFVPTITNIGNIRLWVAPEVSSLDFANGLTIQGFNIPSILSRRVETDVELRPGQTLAIGGMLDNTMLEQVNKIPLLGDLPIIGFFFRSTESRQERTELLVLVTPYILDAEALPAPPLPTGDAADWNWDATIRKWIRERPVDSTSAPIPPRGN